MMKVRTKQEKQETANLFGQVAYGEVGALARSHQEEAYGKLQEAYHTNDVEQKATLIQEARAILVYWGQGGINKITLHALVGGIMAELAGHDFAIGAVAAGLNEALQKELGEWERENPVANEWVSLAIGAAVDRAMGSSSNIGAAVALAGTKYNWDHHGHCKILGELGFPADDFDRLAAEDKAWDNDTMTFHKGHAMPNYEVGPESWRLAIRDFCAGCLEYAISAKLSGDCETAIHQLAVAIHVVADDYSHRQVNGDMIAHGLMDDVPEGNGTFGIKTPWVDNYRKHPEQFNRAIEAARCVCKQYVDGNDSTTRAQLEAVIDWCFPIIAQPEQPNLPSNFNIGDAFGGQ